MYYFGTTFNEYGHYCFDIRNQTFQHLPYLLPKDTPFNPEQLTYNLRKGETSFYQCATPDQSWTVIAIAGSCKDTRPGTKSVFGVKEYLSKQEMVDRLMNNALAKKIIETMPFEVKF